MIFCESILCYSIFYILLLLLRLLVKRHWFCHGSPSVIMTDDIGMCAMCWLTLPFPPSHERMYLGVCVSRDFYDVPHDHDGLFYSQL